MHRLGFSVPASIALALVPLLCPATAIAGDGADIGLQAFRPAMDSRGLITVNGTDVLGPGSPSIGLVTTWGRGLLRFEQDGNRYEVQHIVTPTLVGAIGFRLLGLSLEAGGALPFAIMAGDRSPDSDSGTPGDPNDDERYRFDGQGLGDASLHLKWRVLRSRRAGVGLAVIGSVSLPTASDKDHWLGDGAAVPELLLCADLDRGRLHAAVNAGVRWRGGAEEFRDDQPDATGRLPLTMGVIEAGSSLPFGAGAAYAIVPERFDAVAELFGRVPLGGENYFPLEAVGGIKAYLATSSYLTLGAGAGLLGDTGGNPDLRAFLGIVFEPGVADRDGDGIPDPDDACPDEAEDRDGFADSDGCPELDNDRDGIPDPRDACPDDPEDRDGFEDEDGCPDPDADPEDTGFLDSDGDLITDDIDACDHEREVYNTVKDEDGCPDHGPVIEVEGEIQILEVIQFEFDSAVIKEESHGILRAVAKTILLNDALLLVDVQGHTDDRGSAAYNLDLSQRRAESVRDFLASEGVDRSRLEARGYGESRPLVRQHNEEAWAANRRVQFIIAERRGD